MLGHLHREHRPCDGVDIRSAVLRGYAEVVEADLLGGLDERGELLGAQLARVGVERRLEWQDLLSHEPAHRQAQLALLLGGLEVHRKRRASADADDGGYPCVGEQDAG